MTQPSLPGFDAPYIRLDITLQPDGYRSLRVFAAQGPGFVSTKESDLFIDLTAGEVLDVVDATLGTLLPPQE